MTPTYGCSASEPALNSATPKHHRWGKPVHCSARSRGRGPDCLILARRYHRPIGLGRLQVVDRPSPCQTRATSSVASHCRKPLSKIEIFASLDATTSPLTQSQPCVALEQPEPATECLARMYRRATRQAHLYLHWGGTPQLDADRPSKMTRNDPRNCLHSRADLETSLNFDPAQRPVRPMQKESAADTFACTS
jgi:hypothetical protein